MITFINENGFAFSVQLSSLLAPIIIGLCVTIAFYVLRSIGIFVLAKRAGINKRFLAFIPFVWIYLACKLIGNAQIFGRTFSQLAVLFCVIFSVAGYLQFIFDFLLYFPIAGNLLYGREIFIIAREELASGYTPTLAQGIYGGADFVNPYKEALYTIYNILNVSSYFLSVLNIASLVIGISVYFNLFKNYWPQHYMLFGILSIFGLSAPFVFAIRNKKPINFNDYLRSRYGVYGGHYGNPYGGYSGGNPYGNGYNQGGYRPEQTPPKSPFEEFAGKGEKDPGNPFEEFDNKK